MTDSKYHSYQSSMVRVVFNGRFLSQIQTGVQRYARETLIAIDELLAQRRSDLPEVQAFLAVPEDANPPKLHHIQVRVLPFLKGHLWEQITLPWFARHSYLVNFNYSGPLLKKRQMITIHDATVAASPSSFTWKYRLIHQSLVALLKGRVDTIMTVSDFSRRELEHHFGISNALVGLEGWQHSVASGDGLSTLHKFDLKPGQYLLAVGSRKPNKNFDVIDRALQIAHEFPMTIAVAGASDIGIFKHADAQGKHLRMLGFVTDEELGHLYKHAAWFIFPSIYEGFGLPAIEAMGNGCPVIAARAASIPEVCGDAAMYFDPHEPASLVALLRRIVQEPGLRDTQAGRMSAQLARYSWQENARILLSRLFERAAFAPEN
ncbi:MAG: glycosyltransferase family 4 protein [Burkholderiaceae bacterium]